MRSSSEVAAQQRNLLDSEVAFAASFPSSTVLYSTDYQLQERLAGVNLKPTYYFALTNVFNPETVARKIDGLRSSNPAILVITPEGINFSCPSEAWEQAIVSRWLRYPYSVRRKHDTCQIYEPFFAYIRQNYTQVSPGSALWMRNPIDPPVYADQPHSM
jgi:hypothetical protein